MSRCFPRLLWSSLEQEQDSSRLLQSSSSLEQEQDPLKPGNTLLLLCIFVASGLASSALS
jgi:hypothetical protein